MKKLSAAAFAFGLLSVSVSQALAADATVNFAEPFFRKPAV